MDAIISLAVINLIVYQIYKWYSKKQAEEVARYERQRRIYEERQEEDRAQKEEKRRRENERRTAEDKRMKNEIETDLAKNFSEVSLASIANA